MMILTIVVVICGILVIYHHVVYPILLKLLARRLPQTEPVAMVRAYQQQRRDLNLPRITLVIPAHNEAAVIADKIRNLSFVDYPSEKLEVIVACDGCTDDTATIARKTKEEPECVDLNCTILELTPNRGKVAILNEIVPNISTDIVALSDASALISIDALLIAVAHFDDPELGVVSGTYRMLSAGSSGEEAYWNYQTAIKLSESALGAPLGAHGAFYLFRRKLFHALPSDTINDDFIIPMEMVADGYRAVYEPRIMALELECADLSLDHDRRRRIAAGNVQQALRLMHMLNPKYRGVAFTFASGKALRAFMPFCLLILLVGSIVLAPSSVIFLILAALQLLVYGLALLKQYAKSLAMPGFMNTVHYLVSGHFAGLVGAVRYLTGKNKTAWKKATSMEKQQSE